MIQADSSPPAIVVNARPRRQRGRGRKPNRKYDPSDAAPLQAGTLKDLPQRTPFK
jgi:hypothetical protein